MDTRVLSDAAPLPIMDILLSWKEILVAELSSQKASISSSLYSPVKFVTVQI